MKFSQPKGYKEMATLKKATINSIVIRNIDRKASQCYYKKLEGFKADDLVFWADYFDILKTSGKIANCSIIKRQYGNTNKIIVEFTREKKDAQKAFAMVDQYLNGVDD
jgi:hypothetical protein